MIYYKINILEELKKAGYTTYRLRKEKLIAECTIQKYRNDVVVPAVENLDILCKLLKCQPGDIIGYK